MASLHLTNLADQFAEVQRILKPLQEQAEALKVQLREAAKDEDSRMSDASVTLRVPTSRGEVVTITSTDPKPAQPLDAEALCERIGWEAFHEVARIKTVDFDVEAWKQLVVIEAVSPQDLLESLGEAPKPSAWAVSAKLKS